MDSNAVRRAIFNMSGPKLAGITLQVSTSAIGKWSRNSLIPNLEKAKRVADASGIELSLLRPRFEQ